LYGLWAWREQAGYSPREQAALAWAESLTDAPRTRVPDSDFQAAREHFSPKELGDLSYAVAQINAWNRLCVAFRIEPQHGISATKDQR
jgi:alkylhydroperoxidase family enzyme